MSNTPDSSRLESEPESLRIEIVVDDEIVRVIDQSGLRRAAIHAARERGFCRGEIGIRVTTDSTIQLINRQHLGHDYATDVISFGYLADPPEIEGELVVSIDTAMQQAAEVGWPVDHELALYIIHGTLHITGMDDHQRDDRAAMRSAEQTVMKRIGIAEAARFGVAAEASLDGDIHE